MDADAILDRRRLKRRLAIWRIAAIVAVAAAVAIVGERIFKQDDAHIARLSVSGLIVDDFDRDEALQRVAGDDDVRALILRINSPGGTTAGSEALFIKLRQIADNKPVVAVIGTVAASGGYIAAAAADHIIARETSITGSIGVLMQTTEVTSLLEKLGITAIAVKSSPLKGQPSPLEPFSADARRAIQEVVSDSYRWFVDLVRDRRALSEAEALRVSDGRIYTGRQAFANKLVDALGGEEEARDWLQRERKIAAGLPMRDLKYGKEDSLVDRLVRRLAGKVLAIEPLTLDGLVSVWHPQ